MQAMGLDELAHVQKFPQERGRTGWSDTCHGIACLGGSQMMTDGTNAADARSDHRHFEVHSPFRELFETSELVHVEEGLLHLSIIIQVYGHPCVALDAGHGRNGDFLTH